MKKMVLFAVVVLNLAATLRIVTPSSPSATSAEAPAQYTWEQALVDEAAREAERARLDDITQTSSALFARGERYEALKAKQLDKADPDTSIFAAKAQTPQERYEILKQRQLEQAEAQYSPTVSATPTWRERYEALKAGQLDQAEAR